MGYLQGENHKTYAEITEGRILDFFINLRHTADYIILDLSSDINDILTREGLKTADTAIRLFGADLKGISYFKSVLPLLSERAFNINNHIKVLSLVKDYEPNSTFVNEYGGVSYELPYTKEIEKQYKEGMLFDDMTDRHSRQYKNTVNKIFDNITKTTK